MASAAHRRVHGMYGNVAIRMMIMLRTLLRGRARAGIEPETMARTAGGMNVPRVGERGICVQQSCAAPRAQRNARLSPHVVKNMRRHVPGRQSTKKAVCALSLQSAAPR